MASRRFHLEFAMAFSAIALISIIGVSPATKAQTVDQSSRYISQTDEDLTIRKVALLPTADNIGGIYSRPIDSQLQGLLKAYHQWDLVDGQVSDAIPSVDELEENPSLMQKITGGIEADAILIAKASKGPTGLTIKLDLFLKKDGKLLAQEVLKDHPRFETQDVKQQVEVLFRKLLRKIPYDGLILSRQGNRVTINLGRADGITQDQVLSVVQIVKVTRHPKFNFIVSTEKEILGKIKVLKVEDKLSFGSVISELDGGVIRKMHKVAGLDQVTYPVPESLGGGEGGGDPATLDKPENKMTFGNNPEEWKPIPQPSFGSLGLKLGVGTYSAHVALASESLEGKSSFYPSLGVQGELWLSPIWIMRVELLQGVLETNNPKSGSSPSTLNHSISRYSLAIGYNLLLQDDFFGPKLQFRLGIMTNRAFVDDSAPVAFTTTTYSGVLLGLHGSLPLTEKREWYLGGGVNFVPFPTMREQPVSSGGSAKSSINDFELRLENKFRENIRLTGSLEFSVFSSSFTGTGTRSEAATSMSQRQSRLTGGVEYLF